MTGKRIEIQFLNGDNHQFEYSEEGWEDIKKGFLYNDFISFPDAVLKSKEIRLIKIIKNQK